MPYFIAASPLVKIFLPEWHDRLQENPDQIYDYETPFDFIVDTGTTAKVVKFNIPQVENDINMYRFLTGGMTGAESRQTDIYGIVQFDPKIDIVSTFDELATLEDYVSDDPKKQKSALKKQADLRKETSEKIKKAREKVRLESEARIKRHIRMNHNNLIKQWQDNEERKVGKYPPSVSELIGAYAIDKEIAVSNEKSAEIKRKMSHIMSNQAT